jgi:prevent-host-death family protein
VNETVSVRELRNSISALLRRVEGGEQLTITVDRRPVAELVPLRRRRSVPAGDAVSIAERYAADPELLSALREAFPDSTDDM